MTTTNDTSPPDLDAIEARLRAAQWPARMDVHDDGDVYVWEADGGEVATIASQPCWMINEIAVARADSLRHMPGDIAALVARVRELAAKLDASAQAFDALVADVWRAAGETHEPPADVGALVARVAAARREGAEAMREQCAQAAARVASAWARCECRCACGSSLAGLAAAEACAAEIRALPIVEAP